MDYTVLPATVSGPVDLSSKRPNAQANQLPLDEHPTVNFRALHPVQPAIDSYAVDYGCLVALRLLQYPLLLPHRCVCNVRHVEFLEPCVPEHREAVRLGGKVVDDSILFPEEGPVLVAKAGAGHEIRHRQSSTRPQPAMNLFQQRAAVV